ncbi:unnamed protein product, partial [Didymodactylos carnosus]
PTKTVTEIVRQMKDEWNLKTPSVILSIIGTTWIITESANTQIMIDINEAIEQYCDNDSKAPTWITIENSNPKNGINEHLTTFLKEKITKKYGNYYLKLDNKIYDRFEIEQECCRLVNLSNEENVFIEIIKQTTKLNEFMEDNIDNQAQNQIDMIAQDLLIILNNLYDVISSEYALMQSNIGVLRTVQWKINIFKSKVKELLQNISSNYLVQLVEQIFDDAYDLSAICKNLTIPLVYILVGEEASLNEGIFLGDNTSIETVRKVVDEGIPVIVINGTEGVASVIGSLYGSIHDTSARNETEERYNPTTPNTPLHTRLERHSLVRVQEKRESFKTIDQNALNKLLQPENGNFGIFMYQPGDQHLNQVLLQAIAKGTKCKDLNDVNRLIELKLAIQWKRFDLANAHILTTKTIGNWKHEELDECLEYALLMDSVEFVERLIQCGASFKRLEEFSDITYYMQKLTETEQERFNKIRSPPSNVLHGLIIELMPFLEKLIQNSSNNPEFLILLEKI